MNGFFKGNWCRFPRIGTVGGPGGKPRGRWLAIAYRVTKDTKQIVVANASQLKYLYITRAWITSVKSGDVVLPCFQLLPGPSRWHFQSA